MVGRTPGSRRDHSGEREGETLQAQLYGFRAVCVFDVSQTEGKDLPTLAEVRGDVSGYWERLVMFVEAQGIELNYSEKMLPETTPATVAIKPWMP